MVLDSLRGTLGLAGFLPGSGGGMLTHSYSPPTLSPGETSPEAGRDRSSVGEVVALSSGLAPAAARLDCPMRGVWRGLGSSPGGDVADSASAPYNCLKCLIYKYICSGGVSDLARVIGPNIK